MKRMFVLLAAAAVLAGCAAAGKGGEGSGMPARAAPSKGDAAAETAESRAARTARRKTAYARYLHVVQSRELTRSALRLAEMQGQLARERFADGRISRKAMNRAQQPASRLRSELAEQSARMGKLHAEFNTLADRPPGTPLARPQQWSAVPETTEAEYVKLADTLRAANPDFFAQDARSRRAGVIRQVAESRRYPTLDSGTRQAAAVNELIRTPLRTGRAARELEGPPWWWGKRDKAGASKLADLLEHLAALPATGPARRQELALRVLNAKRDFKTALTAHEAGRKDFSALIEAQMQIFQLRQAELKLQLERQERMAEIEFLLGEKL